MKDTLFQSEHCVYIIKSYNSKPITKLLKGFIA